MLSIAKGTGGTVVMASKTGSSWRVVGGGAHRRCIGWRALPLVVAALFAAVPAQAESMLDALNATYRFNPRLDAARATLRGQDEEVARANAGYRPTVNGTADVGYQNVLTTPNSAALAGETHPRGYGVNAVQPLFRGFDQPRVGLGSAHSGLDDARHLQTDSVQYHVAHV